MGPKLTFWWIKDPDTRADLLYDLAREERDIESWKIHPRIGWDDSPSIHAS